MSQRENGTAVEAIEPQVPVLEEGGDDLERRQDQKSKDQPSVRIKEEFKQLMLPQRAEERALLEKSLLEEGCRDPLIIWKGYGILLDGHNRLEICQKHGLPYEVREIDLPDEEHAQNRIIANQLGRRNLRPDQISYLRGKRYNAEKQSHGGNRKGQGSSGNDCRLKTEERLAKEFKVSPRTIRNDGEFAERLDALVESCGETVKEAVLQEDKFTRKEVVELAKLPSEKQREAVDKRLAGNAEPVSARPAQQKAQKPARKTITLPATPAALAKALVNDHGDGFAGRVLAALEKLLKSEGSKRRKGRSRGRKGPASSEEE